MFCINGNLGNKTQTTLTQTIIKTNGTACRNILKKHIHTELSFSPAISLPSIHREVLKARTQGLQRSPC